MVIPAACRAADDATIMAYIEVHSYLVFGIKIHNNGLPGEGEIQTFSLDVAEL